MTAMPRDLVRKQPAEVTVHRPEPTVINGHVVRKGNGAGLAGIAVALLLALIFAGFLLSTI